MVQKPETEHLRNIASIFIAELVAIIASLSQLTQLSLDSKYVLLKGSLFLLRLINDPFNSNPTLQRIHLTLSNLNSIGSTIVFNSIPSHVGLLEHGAMDLAAKQAITAKHYLPDKDYNNYFRSFFI